jgi:hypothetical protein
MSISRSTSASTQTRAVQITGKVFEQRVQVNFTQSKAMGQLLTLEELPKFLSTGGIKDLENTTLYKQIGYTSFFLDTIGTMMDGTYKFNATAQTVQEMFKEVSKYDWEDLPFSERAQFGAGNKPLRVYLSTVGTGCGIRERLSVHADGSPDIPAPVVVIKCAEQKPEITGVLREDAK